MDREIWTALRVIVKRVCRNFKFVGRKPRFPHRQILLMYLWSVWQGGSLNWACNKLHYGALFRPRKLLSISQFRRRVSEDIFQALLLKVHLELVGGGFFSPVKYIDGKPQLVSPVSKDRDARNGHITGGFGKGYKLHAIISENRRIVIWSVMPLNVAEQSVALAMTEHLGMTPMGLLLADSNYDSAPFHKALTAGDHRLLTPLKAQQRVKGGVHHPVTLRQMGPQRREALEAWKKHPDLAKYVLKSRNNAEGVFSVLTVALNGGSPPPWVRNLARVRRWVGAIIILYNVRLDVQEKLAEKAAREPHMN
jgi:DDE family transposase